MVISKWDFMGGRGLFIVGTRLWAIFVFSTNVKQKCVKVKVAQSCPPLCDPMDCQTPLSEEFSRQEYWSGSCALRQGIFPTQGSNPGLAHCRQMLYQLSYQESPWLLFIGCNSVIAYGVMYQQNPHQPSSEHS